MTDLAFPRRVAARVTALMGIRISDLDAATIQTLSVDGPARIGTLADRIVMTTGGVTKLTTRLEATGIVTRTGDPDDRRITVVDLTTRGRAIARSISAITNERDARR